MPDIKKISDWEQTYFELKKIQRQLDALSDFLLSKMRDGQAHKPKTEHMLDPRTGRKFGEKVD